MLGYFQRVKICCTLAGAAAVLVGQKIAESETVRKTAVDVMAAGIRAVNGAADFVKGIYNEAADKVNGEDSADNDDGCGEEKSFAGDGVSDDSVQTYNADPATD